MDTSFLVFIFIILFWIVIASGVLVFGLWRASRSKLPRLWPTVRGSVESCFLDSQEDEHGTLYEIFIEYSYTVNGQEYTNDRLAFDYDGSRNRAAQEEIVSKIQSAKQVEVRFSPADPQIATLTYGVTEFLRKTIIYSILGLIFFVGFLAMAVVISYADHIFPQQF